MKAIKLKRAFIHAVANVLGRKTGYKIRYYHNRGHWPNLKHPKDLSEILISKILTNEFVKYAPYADKIQVREYIKEKGLGEHLLTHYHYWDSPSKIKSEDLPDKFVLKTSNGAGGKYIVVCQDKKDFNLENAKKIMAKSLSNKAKYEFQYNVIKPFIICEELMETGSDVWPTDYKITCIHGQPVDIFVCSEREKEVKFCTRNIDWSDLPNIKQSYLPTIAPKRPKHLDEMIEIARILSADFDFVRVDLYEYNDKVYFGELTFSPWGGLLYGYTDDAIKKYGELFRRLS